MKYPQIDEPTRLLRLTPPAGTVDMVLDTDTANEIDDQFAVAYALLSPGSMRVQSLYAAPFFNPNSTSPANGMERSYQEILRLLDRLGRSPEDFVFKGATGYLPGPEQPVDSPAARDLIAKALAPREGPLYVLAIGAITNVASAILLEPAIIERVVVVWLGGHPYYWPHTVEFNLQQDLHAARVVLNCGVPFVHIPCKNVAEHLTTTLPELEVNLKGRNPISDYLYAIFYHYRRDHFAWTKVLWDVSTVAWLVDHRWVPTVLTHSPILTDQVTWSRDESRHLVRVAIHCDRNAIFADLFRKLQEP